MTQVRVHRKDNSARFKDMERWMEKNLTGEGVGAKNRLVIKESQAREPRRSPRRTVNPDKEVQHEGVDSEEPTEFGLSHTGTVITTATNATFGICDSNNAMEQPSTIAVSVRLRERRLFRAASVEFETSSGKEGDLPDSQAHPNGEPGRDAT